MLLLSTDFKSICNDAHLYVDTNVFIYAHEQPEMVDLIADLIVNLGTSLATISSVEYEFTRGAQSLKEISDRKSFLRGLVHRVIPVGNLLESDKNDVFSAAMSLIVRKKDSQYTDYLLAALLHKFSGGSEKHYVLSADTPAFPKQLFNIEGVVSLRIKSGDVVHINLISLNADSYQSLIAKIAST